MTVPKWAASGIQKVDRIRRVAKNGGRHKMGRKENFWKGKLFSKLIRYYYIEFINKT